MMWLEAYSGKTDFYGVDIDERAIKWAQENLTFASFTANQPLPPLPYEDGYFDLVINHSVFTHIDESYGDAWLEELHRVTSPGATLILSVHGEYAFENFIQALIAGNEDPRPYRDKFDREGILFVDEDAWLGGSFPDFYHTTFHAPWYVFQHWGRFFKIKAFLPTADLGLQDFVILERQAGPLPAREDRREQDRRPAQPAADSTGSTPGVALERATRLVDTDPDIFAPTRFGRAGWQARSMVLRMLRNYRSHQRAVDAAMLECLREAAPAGPGIARSMEVLTQALKQQGERINRLEADVLSALEKITKGAGRPD